MEYPLYPIKLFLRRIPVIIMVSAMGALNLFSWLWLLLQIPKNTEQVFLHYNILFGVDKIGERGDVYSTPLIGLALVLLNIIGAWLLYRKDWFFSYLVLATGVMVNIFIAISSVLIVFLNI